MMKVREWGSYDRPLNTVDFESPAHSGTLLSGLNDLRSKGDLLDVTLLAEGESFQAHRVVLASCSDYFRAMFTDAMRESRQSEICLNGVTAEGIRLLLNYAYTSRLALNLANIQDVLSAASHVQVVAVVEACSNYLQSQLDLENCVDIATIAETYSLVQLRRRVYRFISGHLQEFSMSNEFQRLAPQQLEYLLACEFPVDCPEEEVLRIVLKWLENSDVCGFTHRLSFASRLLRKIHFREIPSWKLDNLLQKVFIDQSIEKQSIYKIVIRETYRQIRIPNKIRETAFTKSHSNHLVNSRGMELAIVKVGGFSIGGITNEITYCLSKGKWRHLTSIPHVEQCNFGTAVLDNELYVVGGSFNQSLQENIHPFGFRYSPRYNKWTTIAPMQRERCRFSLNVLSGRLYAIGGSSELEEFVDGCTDQEEISACECYDPASDSWSSISPLPEGRSQHASVTWCNNTNEKYIFISGGLERDLTSDTVRRYDPSTDTWDLRAPMLSPRADHVMISLGHRIYVCGGWFEDSDIGSRVLVDTIDAYDLTTDSWEVITRVPTPRYHAGIVEVDGKIYFIGGFHSDAMFDRDTAAIECYDVENDFWTTEEKYPQDVWEHTCVTLYIPKCRDDMEVMTTNENRR